MTELKILYKQTFKQLTKKVNSYSYKCLDTCNKLTWKNKKKHEKNLKVYSWPLSKKTASS